MILTQRLLKTQAFAAFAGSANTLESRVSGEIMLLYHTKHVNGLNGIEETYAKTSASRAKSQLQTVLKYTQRQAAKTEDVTTARSSNSTVSLSTSHSTLARYPGASTLEVPRVRYKIGVAGAITGCSAMPIAYVTAAYHTYKGKSMNTVLIRVSRVLSHRLYFALREARHLEGERVRHHWNCFASELQLDVIVSIVFESTHDVVPLREPNMGPITAALWSAASTRSRALT
ncbi:hypothetical protein BC629DRAFT_1441965 [Irpex lacteus]|nr:hypothetical protein BC629DRAFT_1441965 [Irpex lacteus]